MKKFWAEFKAFIMRGNILDMAVGVIIGAAFSAIVTALTNKIFMPFINLIVYACTGGKNVNLITVLNGKPYLVDDGAGNMIVNTECIFIDWGAFIIAIINFVLIALVLFLIIKAINKAQDLAKKGAEARPTKTERAELKAMGVNMKNLKEVKAKTAELRAEKQAKLEAEKAEQEKLNHKPTTEELLTDILTELKANRKI